MSSRSNTSIAKSTASDNDQEEESKETSSAHVASINIEPLQMQLLIKPDDVKQKQDSGNFDDMLTYIDASVVSEWLNRANRSLRKMHKWHQDNSGLFNEPSSNRTKQSQYEPFILFASFWLGSHPTARFDHKQRRQLIEMEHSIICDEVQQAFQVGIESQQIGIADTHRLLRAVLKEYPLQFLSFRGVYLLLDYIEILSSNRQDDYKKLLSDVKCRTLNKQYAQWLLSIRSFALINLCWSIVKFYRRTLEKEVNCFKTTSSTSQLEELDGRLSSLSISNKETVVSKPNVNSSCSSLSNSSTSSSTSSSSSSLLKKRLKNSSLKKENEQDFLPILNQVKYDLYVENAYKHDLPDVLHYLILTKKCDPFKRDEQGRTLIFLAVINDRPKILNYLIKRWPSIDVNEQCHSGNTPLHAAVNKGNQTLVDIILQSLNNENEPINTDTFESSSTSSLINEGETTSRSRKSYKLDINKINEKCMNSTALHLAVWNDFNEIALRLVQNNADPNLKMNGTTTAFDLALENSNQVLYELLNEFNSLGSITKSSLNIPNLN